MRKIVIFTLCLINLILIGLTFSKNTGIVFIFDRYFYCWYLVSSISCVALLFLKLQELPAITIFLLNCFLLNRLTRILDERDAIIGLSIVFFIFIAAWIFAHFKNKSLI